MEIMNSTVSASGIQNNETPRSKYVIDHPIPKLTKDGDKMEFFNIVNLITELPYHKAWPFQVGLPLLATSIASTAIYINNHFRKSLLLMHYLRFTSYMGMVFVPSATGSFFFMQFISSDIIQQQTKCGICLQTKAAVLQGVSGVLYPLILAPLVSFPTAGSLEGSHLPSITKRPKEVFAYSLEVMRPMWPKLRVLTICHIVLAMGITHFQFDYFHSKILPYVTTGSVEKREPILKL